jgi:ABC-type sugar transport system permease subunit
MSLIDWRQSVTVRIRKKKDRDWRTLLFLVVALLVILSMLVWEWLYLVAPVQ